LHPSVRPHRGVLAGEMDSAFGPRDVRQQRAELAGFVVGGCAARPFVLIPALRAATLEMLADAGENGLHMVECEADSVRLGHAGDPPRLHADGISLQNAASALLRV